MAVVINSGSLFQGVNRLGMEQRAAGRIMQSERKIHRPPEDTVVVKEQTA